MLDHIWCIKMNPVSLYELGLVIQPHASNFGHVYDCRITRQYVQEIVYLLNRKIKFSQQPLMCAGNITPTPVKYLAYRN